MDLLFETPFLRYVIDSRGRNAVFEEKSTGNDYLARDGKTPCAVVVREGTNHPCERAGIQDDFLRLSFPGANLDVRVRVIEEQESLRFQVEDVSHQDFHELRFLNIPLHLDGMPEESFAACVLALNLKTRVEALPGPQKSLQASCYPRIGCAGAEAALLAMPMSDLRQGMKRVVSRAPGLPTTDVGGAWALDAPINRGSYLFDFGDLTERTVDDWIALAHRLGLTQIDFHAGKSLRFGDCRPHPELFPEGRKSVKAVIDRLHAAGLKAGLHTYAFFIAKDTPYVVPVPDSRLGKDASFTLAESIDEVAAEIPVLESTEDRSTTTGFFVRNSVTLQVEDELITYSGISKQEPYAFTQCVRGAYGTQASSHEKGAKVHHLKECFGLFCPDAESTLLAEIASHTADTYNECGFDMIYLDALDGEDILAGREWSWHYGSKFVFEIAKRLQNPALFEMSTFHHHLWFVRGRMGAWDHPSRAHKRFIDVHCAANHAGRGMFLPMNLGWWATKTWSEGPHVTQIEPTFPDDIEYLLGKCVGYDMGLALMGVNPTNIGHTPAYERLAPMFQVYEGLRHAQVVPESLKRRLRVLGDEYHLVKDENDWRFCPVRYEQNRVTSRDTERISWVVENPFMEQGLRARIEPLMGLRRAGDASEMILEGFDDLGPWTSRAKEQVQGSLEPGETVPATGERACMFRAKSERSERTGSWIQMIRVFDPPLNLGNRQGLSLWVKGDGSGTVLNVQLRSPEHTTHGGCGDHYIRLDFEGWKLVELVEPESAEIEGMQWPYGGAYAIYRETVDYGQIERLSLWYNLLPQGQEVVSQIGPIHAVPISSVRCSEITLFVQDKEIKIPFEIKSGMFVECHPTTGAFLFGPKGEAIDRFLWPDAEAPPLLRQGQNVMGLRCGDWKNDVPPRFRVTIMSLGEPLDPLIIAPSLDLPGEYGLSGMMGVH